MLLTLRLSESILSIYKDAGRPLSETISLCYEGSVSIRQVIIDAGIHPLLTPLIAINEKTIKDLDQLITKDSVITLIGPLAGG